MPASRSARAMIFAPRSCPSKPGLATTTRILPLDAASTAGRDATRQMRDKALRPVRSYWGAILVAILLIAAALRLIAVGDTLSHDEGYTWLVASAHSPATFLDRLTAFENTPPLYYLLTWPLPDVGEPWLRIVSVLAGIGCVAATYWTARSTFTAATTANVDLAAGFA